MSRSDEHQRGFGTRAIRVASSPPVVHQGGNSVPIYQSVTFEAEDAAELGDILADRRPGYAYARSGNPTAAAMADAFAQLHGAPAGFAFASGMAAIHAALLSQLRAGDRFVSTQAVYGSTRTLMSSVLARFGVEVEYVDATDPDAVEDALRTPTRVLYLETIANPTIVVADLADLAERAHRHGAVVIVDNTFASPYLCRPFELGADLVVESTTKWVGGHSDVLAGAVAGHAELMAQVRETEIETGGMIAPVRGVPGAARHGDAARAHGPPRGQRPGARPMHSRRVRRCDASSTRVSTRIPRRPSRGGSCATVAG